jgi:membrane protease subunit HflK
MSLSPWDKNPNDKNGQPAFGDWLQQSSVRQWWQKNQSSEGKPSGGKDGGGQWSMPQPPQMRLLGAAAAVLALLWLASGFFIVQPDEQAVILRFGRYVRLGDSGPNYALPMPIESVIKHPVARIEREEVGFRTTGRAMAQSTEATTRDMPAEALMLTGDENIVNVHFIVQWKIRDIKDYVLNLKWPKYAVRSVAESAMREVMGHTALASVLTGGRALIEADAAKLMQSVLDDYGAGIAVVGLQLLKVDPPTSEVISAFRDVQTALQNKEQRINEARGYRNKILPQARGEANRKIQEAEAYHAKVVERARGEARRFELVLEQYLLAKDVTRKRLHLEALEEVMQGMPKTILDQKAQPVLPYLPVASKLVSSQ